MLEIDLDLELAPSYELSFLRPGVSNFLNRIKTRVSSIILVLTLSDLELAPSDQVSTPF